ncbi:MAG: cadherin-like beta sandwich domain-containing protein [Clostridia bacterium]|nr:cadherin-like beta sandwich domain-containing protein [Clostridia bacterium]
MNNIFKLKSLKRIVLVIGLLIISFSSLTAFASGNKITAGIDKTSYKAGETLKLQLNLKGEKKVSAFIVEAIYPEGVSYSSIEKSSGIKEGFAEIYDSGSKVSFVYTFKNGKALNPQDNILTFKFKVTENIKGENEIKLYIKGVLDEEGEKIFADSSGSVRFSANPPKEAVKLIKLKPSSGSLTPAFSPDVYNYTMSVPYSTESITFEVEYEGEAKASVNRKNLGSGGSVTDFLITLTPSEGEKIVYKVSVKRGEYVRPSAGITNNQGSMDSSLSVSENTELNSEISLEEIDIVESENRDENSKTQSLIIDSPNTVTIKEENSFTSFILGSVTALAGVAVGIIAMLIFKKLNKSKEK